MTLKLRGSCLPPLMNMCYTECLLVYGLDMLSIFIHLNNFFLGSKLDEGTFRGLKKTFVTYVFVFDEL